MKDVRDVTKRWERPRGLPSFNSSFGLFLEFSKIAIFSRKGSFRSFIIHRAKLQSSSWKHQCYSNFKQTSALKIFWRLQRRKYETFWPLVTPVVNVYAATVLKCFLNACFKGKIGGCPLSIGSKVIKRYFFDCFLRRKNTMAPLLGGNLLYEISDRYQW